MNDKVHRGAHEHSGQTGLSTNRREWLRMTTGVAVAAAGATWGDSAVAGGSEQRLLEGMIGFTTGGLNHQRRAGKLTLLSLPRFARDQLGMRLIDLNSHWLESYEESYLERIRETAEEAECFFTNLKINHQFGDLYSHDPNERERAMSNGRRLINVAKTLRARWIRFVFPALGLLGDPPNPVAHRELASFAGQRGIQLLVENLGWLVRDPNSVTRMVKLIGPHAAACPDTGNWDDDIRYDALARTFPRAVSCDFKAFELAADGRHEKYDIRRCFEIGWHAGFRGPWVVEHSNADMGAFIRETVYLRDRLEGWIEAAG